MSNVTCICVLSPRHRINVGWLLHYELSSRTSVNNPLAPKSDQRLISPYNITPESNTKVMRKEEMITN